jgi:beta-glucanase (GH16 family)
MGKYLINSALLRQLKRTVFAILAIGLFYSQAKAGWVGTFSDEFNSSSVDFTKWKPTGYWNDQTLSGNGEKECYVPSALSVSNGFLNIKADRGYTPMAQCKGASADMQFTSGMITTSPCNPWDTYAGCSTNYKPFSQQYGYFEIRAKFPKQQGMWPAFWLIPADASWPPEIDTVEWLGRTPNTAYMTYHYLDSANQHIQDGQTYTGPDFSIDFHSFGVDWSPGLLIFYIDGVERARHSGPDVTTKAMYIIANLAVGGYWPGDPDSTSVFPAYMQVDYIRAFARVNDGQPDAFPPGVNGTPYPGDSPTPSPTPSPAVDTTVPSVVITSPVSGITVAKGARVTASASASDNVGVKNVNFYLDGMQKCSNASAPYSCSFKMPRTTGAHMIEARAYDAAGNVGSNNIQINVK